MEENIKLPVDMERVEDVCGRIGKYGAKVSKLSSSHLLAEVPKGASSLVLAIPYEEGWQIFVDGTANGESGVPAFSILEIPHGRSGLL